MKSKRDKKRHESRVNNIQEIAEQYYRNEIGEIPSIDKGFLEIEEPNMRKHVSAWRCLTIAVTIVIVFIIGNMIAAVTLNDSAYGNKGILHRIYQSVRGIDTGKENQSVENEVLEEAAINDWNDLDTAIAFSEGTLYIPEYIPDRYAFECLEMQNMSMGDFSAMYTFEDGSKELVIAEIYSPRSEEVSCTGDGKLIRLNDRVLYLQERDSDGNLYINVYTENTVLQIMGFITEDEAINIAKEMKKPE